MCTCVCVLDLVPLVYMPAFGQYHIALITMDPSHILISGIVISPLLLFVFKVVLAIWGLLWFHMNFSIVLFSVKDEWKF